MSAGKLIVRLSGGLGNQMFGYAAARRLALANGADLVIDPWSGFVRDAVYRRQYALRPFRISARMATQQEMLRPFERTRRALLKRREAGKPFGSRRYIAQQGEAFEPRLLTRKLDGTVFIEGVWPSESYFADVAPQIRSDFERMSKPSQRDIELVEQMKSVESVSIHVRFFKADMADTASNLGAAYYAEAISEMRGRMASPHFFLFSDRPSEAAEELGLAREDCTVVDHHQGDEAAHNDMWLMSQCAHAIIANSTFSWWGAWLGDARPARLVIAPDPDRYPAMGWSSERFLPERWMKM